MRSVRQIGARRCLEVGLAHGISALFTCHAIADQPDPKFISIDPWDDGVQDIGLLNLQRENYSRFVEFHREHSHSVLPRLLAQGVEIDFGYVDTTKIFDIVLIDAFYITRMLRVGGLLALDDCDNWPGPRRVARYLSKWPHLRVHAVHCTYPTTSFRRLTSAIAARLPRKADLYRDELLNSADTLGVNGRCVVFEKIRPDDRAWNWSEGF